MVDKTMSSSLLCPTKLTLPYRFLELNPPFCCLSSSICIYNHFIQCLALKILCLRIYWALVVIKMRIRLFFFFFHLSGCLCVSEREILVRMSNSFLRGWQALQDRRKAYLIIYSLLILK